MQAYTAAELIDAGKRYMAADAERMKRRPSDCPRGYWRSENPIAEPSAFEVRDTALKTRPIRTLHFDCNGSPYDLAVVRGGAGAKIMEHIDLRGSDADVRLARYERVDV